MGSGILETSAALHNIKRDSIAMAAGGSTLQSNVSQRPTERAQFVPTYKDDGAD